MEMAILFFSVLTTEFIAEMGDKTQLMLIGLTSKYKIRDITIGTLAAILILNALAVLAGGFLNQILNQWLWAVKFAAALAFLYFAFSTLLKKEDDDEEGGESKIRFAPLAVFCTFFMAELGDKTQLTAVTFGANYGLARASIVWLACTIGFFLADFLGMLAGLLLKKKSPEKAFRCARPKTASGACSNIRRLLSPAKPRKCAVPITADSSHARRQSSAESSP